MPSSIRGPCHVVDRQLAMRAARTVRGAGGAGRFRSQARSRSVCHARAAVRRRWCFARTGSKSDVLVLMEAGYFSGSLQSSSCRLLVDLEDTGRAEVDGWRRLGFLGEAVMGVDAHGDVWEMKTAGDAGEVVPGVRVGIFRHVCDAEDAAGLIAEVTAWVEGKTREEHSHSVLYVIVDATDWKVIPVENFLAAFGGVGFEDVELVMTCGDANEARLMRDVMEVGVDGVVADLRAGWDARGWAAFVRDEFLGGAGRCAEFSRGEIIEVEQCGMGDRICVDLAENMTAGEGLLVGSFARGLFLVHCECEQTSGYITPRAFRVNAGPPHSYVEQQGDRLGYLSELKSGTQVAVFDWSGRMRGAVVGRIKQERRPLVRLSARTERGVVYSVMLQMAETVKVVGPAADGGFRTISVAEVKEGDEVFLLEHAEAARHTGIAIEETIKEY